MSIYTLHFNPTRLLAEHWKIREQIFARYWGTKKSHSQKFGLFYASELVKFIYFLLLFFIYW